MICLYTVDVGIFFSKQLPIYTSSRHRTICLVILELCLCPPDECTVSAVYTLFFSSVLAFRKNTLRCKMLQYVHQLVANFVFLSFDTGQVAYSGFI